MADFAMRAAYYLKLPAKGPVPLPKIVQRWTVLKSNFIHKESQENFERITLRRLIQIQDGDSEVVKIWLAYLRRYAFWGVGMKANVWEFEGLGMLLSIPSPIIFLTGGGKDPGSRFEPGAPADELFLTLSLSRCRSKHGQSIRRY